jgi:hypothetical protein
MITSVTSLQSSSYQKPLFLLLLELTKVVLYDHEPLKIYLPYKHPYFTSLEKFLGACFSSAALLILIPLTSMN